MVYSGEKCNCKDSLCWLTLVFSTLCCASFVVFLFICSTMFMTNFNMNSTEYEISQKSGILTVYPDRQILFNMSDTRNTSKPYIETLQNIIAEYDCVEGIEDCSNNLTDDRDVSNGQLCIFNVSQLGKECTIENHFGYLQRKPCILLRLEQVNTFVPKPYSSPPSWMTGYRSDHLFVDCFGVRKTDQRRMRKYSVFPADGFPSHFYQAVSRQNMSTSCQPHSPLVAIQFPDLTTGTNITITCQVWSSNVDELLSGSATFSISIV